MLKVDRQERIVELCELRGTVTVQEIADNLGVSPMTVRRDLGELSDQGKITRFHGGAKVAGDARGKSILREMSHNEKILRHVAEKNFIAQKAAELIREGETVFLSAGTTVALMAQCLPRVPLRVVTNSLPTFEVLTQTSEYETILIGGTQRRRTGALVGPLAEEMLSSLGFDKAFMGVNGIWEDSLFTSNADSGRIQRIAFDRAAERYVLADSSKMGVRDFYCFYSLTDVDALITDSNLNPEDLASYSRHTSVMY